MLKNIGIDVGFGFVKVTDGTQQYLFPSVVGEGHDIRFSTGMDTNSVLDNITVGIDGKKYFVGNLANRQSDFIISTQSEKRTESIESIILFKTAFSLMNGSSAEKDEFNLVTGLPVDEYKLYKDILQERLVRVHNLEIFDHSISINKSIEIKKGKVIPQPFGTIFDEMLLDDGKIKNDQYAHSIIGVVDIGFRTTDFVVTNHLEFIDRLSFTSNVALNTAYKLISKELKSRFNITKSIYQLNEIIQSSSIAIKGKVFDITELKDRAFSLAAQQIVSEINSFWPQLWEFEKILITGGGGVALFDSIKSHINNCYLVQNGQFSNVNGYVKVANRSFKE